MDGFSRLDGDRCSVIALGRAYGLVEGRLVRGSGYGPTQEDVDFEGAIMSSAHYDFPVAVSQLKMPDSRDQQVARSAKWLLEQPGGSIVIVTPQKQVHGGVLSGLIGRPGVTHVSWRGLSSSAFAGHRVIYAWPDRKHLQDLWDVEADALVVVEWGEPETAEWIEDANPVRLLPGETIAPSADSTVTDVAPLPNGIDGILEGIAAWAAGYSTGLKWNEEDKLKADMMNRPDRWVDVSVERVRAKCRALGMRPNDVDTVAELLQRRKDGRRFNIGSTYRDFRFN